MKILVLVVAGLIVAALLDRFVRGLLRHRHHADGGQDPEATMPGFSGAALRSEGSDAHSAGDHGSGGHHSD
jgi:hypothetical protein